MEEDVKKSFISNEWADVVGRTGMPALIVNLELRRHGEGCDFCAFELRSYSLYSSKCKTPEGVSYVFLLAAANSSDN